MDDAIRKQFEVVALKYLNDTENVSWDEDGYLKQYDLALKMYEKLSKEELENDRLNYEKATQAKKEEFEQKRFDAEQQKIIEDRKQRQKEWKEEFGFRKASAKDDYDLRKCEIATKERSNRASVFGTIGKILVGVGSVAGGIYLGTRGLQVDKEGYNESPGTLKQAEAITASSTKYL